jgi:hypothetical protein
MGRPKGHPGFFNAPRDFRSYLKNAPDTRWTALQASLNAHNLPCMLRFRIGLRLPRAESSIFERASIMNRKQRRREDSYLHFNEENFR